MILIVNSMKKILATFGIVTTLALGSVAGAQVASFEPRVLPDQAADIAGERVQIRQRGNVVEANFPWKGESGITVRKNLGGASVAEIAKGRRNTSLVAEQVNFGDGGFKIDFILNEKPATNVFCYEIGGAENYDFFYQPALTQQEIDNGAERPEDIVGSYAVYHKTLKNNQYQTGKLMHIPRPQVWEVNNKDNTTVWAELSYSEPNLCVTVDQTYLDNATYPVRVDPTFGYTSVGASTAAFTASDRGESSHSTAAPENGTLSSVSAYLKLNSTGSQGMIGAVWNVNGTSPDLVDNGSETLVTSTTGAWYTSSSFTGSIISGNNYHIGFISDYSGSQIVSYVYDTGTTEFRISQNVSSYPTVPDPASGGNSSRVISAYATYTATGEATTTTNTTISGDIIISGDITISN